MTNDNQSKQAEASKEPQWKRTLIELKDWKLFLRRSLSSDFYRVKATDEERQRLANLEKPVSNELAQDYAAWRRGMLWITSMAIGITMVFQVINVIEMYEAEEKLPGVLQFMIIVLLCLLIGAAGLINQAALSWYDLGKSRMYSRFAWLLLFLGPFLVYCLPAAMFMAEGSTPANTRIQVGFFMAFAAALDLFPRIIGLFAGIIRSSLTLKTLLPESNLPGWLAVITAPLYVLFFLMVLVIVIQTTISFWLVLTLMALLMAPILLLMRSKTLVQPLGPQEGHLVVQQIRRTSLLCVLAGVVFFVIFAATLEIDLDISALDVFNAVAAFIASVLLLTLVMSDLMMGLLIQTFLQDQSFRDTDMEATLTTKYSDLTDVGMGDLDIGESDLIRKIGGAAKSAKRMGKEWVSGDEQPPPPTPDQKSSSSDTAEDIDKQS